MKAVLLSVKPKYCELIFSGRKNVEIRKSQPKLKPPFTCYIYQIKHKWIYNIFRSMGAKKIYNKLENALGKIIGEFICDGIGGFKVFEDGAIQDWYCKDLGESCLTEEELAEYVGKGKIGYAWHISDRTIYKKPKELSEFISYCSDYEKEKITGRCRKCKHYYVNHTDMLIECDCEGERPITRPPQSWYYVEEL